MSEHTAGPWHVGGTFNPDSPDPRQNVWGPTPPGIQSGHIVAKDVTPADGRLICAALDLLAACETALRLMDIYTLGDDSDFDRKFCLTNQQLKAAIAKAKEGAS